jgi:hypothetical protein
METLQFININPEKFIQELTQSITAIVNKPVEDEVLLTQKEVANFYKVVPATINNWQKIGKIKAYSINNERRYKKSELLDELVLMK